MKSIAKVVPNERLKWEREIRGWSQKYVAEQIDAPSVHYISRWERGLITPGSFYREKLCRLFEKDARELGLLQLTEEIDEETTSTAISSSSTAGETSSSGVFLFLTPGSCPVTNLIGREEILSYLSQRLCAGRGGVVTALYGLPGVGKTSLAATFVQRIDVQNFFQDGILWINIGSRPNIAGLLSSCGKLLGLMESEMEKLSSIEARIKAVHVAIGKRQMLLVIDDVWTLEEALPFFKICGVKCAYLVTTRLPNVALRLANDGAIAVRELDGEASLELLNRFVPSVSSQEPEAVRSLIKLVGGLPLALILVGKYLQMHAYSGQPRRVRAAIESLRHISGRVQLFEQQMSIDCHAGQTDNSPISLQAVIQARDERLSSEARRALYALPVLPAKPSSFSEEAVLAVADVSVEILDTLTDAGLLEGAGPGRYTLHRSISDYVYSMQSAQYIKIKAKVRLAAYVLQYLEKNAGADDALERESDLLFAGLEEMSDLKQEAELLSAVSLLAPFLYQRGLHALSEKYLHRAYQAAESTGRLRDSIMIARYLGNSLYRRGDYTQARDWYQQALDLAYRFDEHEQCSDLLSHLGTVAIEQGAYREADAYFQKALVLAHQYGYHELVAKLLLNLGISVAERGNYARAESYFQEGLALARRYAYTLWIGLLLVELGRVRGERGDPASGAEHFQEALEIARKLKHTEMMSTALISQGRCALEHGNYAIAERYLLEGLALARRIEIPHLICRGLQGSGMLSMKRGNGIQAQTYLQEGLTLARQTKHQECLSQLLLAAGSVALECEEYSQAEAYLQECLALATCLEHHERISRAWVYLGRLASRQNKHAQAEACLQEGFSLACIVRKPEVLCLALYAFGEWCLLSQDSTGAARYFQEMRLLVSPYNQEQQAFALYGLARVAYLHDELEEAWKLGSTSLKMFTTLGHHASHQVRQWMGACSFPEQGWGGDPLTERPTV